MALQRHCFVFSLEARPRRLGLYETFDNPHGLLTLSTLDNGLEMAAVPGRTPGQVQLIQLGALDSHRPPVSILIAHTSSLACLQLSPSGTLLATASEKGTLIRVWHVQTLRLVSEVRRGTDRALIYCIAFSKDESRIAESSDKGTVHVFNLHQHQQQAQEPSQEQQHQEQQQNQEQLLTEGGTATASNRQSILSNFSPYLPKYFSSEWSFSSFSLPVEAQSQVAFTQSDMAARYAKDPLLGPVFDRDESGLLVLTADGSLYKYRFDPKKGGDCVLESFYRLHKPLGHPLGREEVHGGVLPPDDYWEDWEEA